MDQNQPNVPQGVPTSAPKKHVGPIIASLIIVLVLIIAALYVFASRISLQNAANSVDNTATTTDQTLTTVIVPVTSTSTDPQSLQDDLNNSTQGIDDLNL